ncbi:OTU domain-containing protein 6B-like [Tropilaelaps mercedesae]|uniref:OTU domain-containing protein 6B-like n=1 Tax=Tropilaelaps mercedesae TaxID=418985 RepID=A0A1V9XB54_9ACAR|nr:OTU domain-containing protein 6B-like [Tropilaelaps mercedesae]
MSVKFADSPSAHSPQIMKTSVLSFEELEIRHKKERKNLQATIMQLKKAVPKGDKKRLKEVQQRVSQMEADFEKKCNDELNEVQTQERNAVSVGTATNGDAEDYGENVDSDPGRRKVSKAEKRREKKRIMELERDRRIAEEEKLNEEGPRAIENQLIKDKLAKQGMSIYDIAADGNCLFSAIAHQLKSRYDLSIPVMEVRRRCVQHLRRNREEFEPFLDGPEDFDEYCSKMETDQSRWGGNLELRAISQEMQLQISVYQSEGPAIEFYGENELDTKKLHLHLTYHRNLIWTGEHYNSAIDIRPGKSDGDFTDKRAHEKDKTQNE